MFQVAMQKDTTCDPVFGLHKSIFYTMVDIQKIVLLRSTGLFLAMLESI